MSVLCARVPNMAMSLAMRHQPELAGQPVALLARDEEVCGISEPAYQAGVRMGMAPRQARMRCPELIVLEADIGACRTAQDAFLEQLSQWELPTEVHGMGMAYVDLHEISSEKKEIAGLAADLGRRVRRALGDDLVPSLGWDHSKFCSRAAAYHTPAGKMKLVAKEDEVTFLAPLPISYLPLPALDIQRLRWLGITTLGQFAKLPASAVFQQFGKAGKLAHRWAQGRDNRPVRPTLHVGWSPLEVEYETPTDQLSTVLDGLMVKLHPLLETWAEELRGCTRLRLELFFANRERRAVGLDWVEPVTQAARLRVHITNQLAGLSWPGVLDRLVVTEAQSAELPTMQRSLFAEPMVETVTLDEVIGPLKHRYGPIFFQRLVVDESHPDYERRVKRVEL